MMKKDFSVDGHKINRLIKKNGAKPVFLNYYEVREVFGAEV